MTDTFKFFIMDSPVVCMLIVFALILFVLIEFALLRLLFNIGDIKKQEKPELLQMTYIRKNENTWILL